MPGATVPLINRPVTDRNANTSVYNMCIVMCGVVIICVDCCLLISDFVGSFHLSIINTVYMVGTKRKRHEKGERYTYRYVRFDDTYDQYTIRIQ